MKDDYSTGLKSLSYVCESKAFNGAEISEIGILTRPRTRRPWIHGSIPNTGREFSLFSKLSQTGSEDHTASYSNGTGSSFPTYKDTSA